jgi:hypothetical protein
MPLPIRAIALSEAGHPVRIQLPPRTTRAVRVDGPLPTSRVVLDRSFALRSIILVEGDSPSELFLYNGGFETQWIDHGQVIAHALPLSTESHS